MRRDQIRKALLALTVAAALAVTGCGPSILNEESTAAEETQQEQEEVAIQDVESSAAPESEAAVTESAQEEAAPAAEVSEEEPAAEEPAEEAAAEDKAEPKGGPALSVEIGSTCLSEYDEESYVQLCSVTYSTAMLSGGDEARYPALQNTLESKNEKARRNAESVFETLKSDVKTYEDPADEYFMAYSDEMKYSVIRADDKIFSLGGTCWTFTGGAHGTSGFTSLNLDPETGRELSVRDIAADPVALMDKMKEILAEKYPGLEANLVDSADMVSEGIADLTAWTMGYDCFTMWFGPGQLGAYAEGSQVVSVPFAGNEALFNEKYLSIPDSYGFDLVERYADLDVDGDGDLEHLELSPEAAEEGIGNIGDMKVSLDGNTVTEEDLDAFDFTPYIAHTGGKTYLYIEYSFIDDYSETTVYDLTGGTPVSTCRTRFREYVRYDQETQTGFRYAFTDPEYGVFGIRSDVLGTGTAYAYIHAGEDGVPTVDDGIYLVRNVPESPMTLKRDIEGDAVDPATMEVTGKIQLPAGLGVDPYRTDLETFVEITTEDGNLVRFEYTPGFPNYVNGIDTQEVFDNIMYAG
ncbi:MAG: DUF4163 domain-containing protein [Lachnospiraceae bacterium]|nr:DUF4163 domain-containing protein [Lachnospiraceae bacterium]